MNETTKSVTTPENVGFPILLLVFNLRFLMKFLQNVLLNNVKVYVDLFLGNLNE